MADILKITTPLTNRNQISPTKQTIDPNTNFEISDLSKVIKSQNESQLQGHNNGLIEKDGQETLLANLLKDPAVTISYLKNIFLMQEVIKLLPVNNTSFTQEIRQLFDALLISPNEIVLEMLRQEHASTSFKGALFDILRDVLKSNSGEQIKYATANFLKALNGEISKQSIMNSVSNGLTFLKAELMGSEKLTGKIEQVISQLNQPNSKDNFIEIKSQVLNLVKDIEKSILFNPKCDKITSIIVYNLSRFRDNPTYLKESLDYLLTIIDGDVKKGELMTAFKSFFTNFDSGQSEKSKVMLALADIVGKQAFSKDLTSINSEKIEKIIHSLLSSPCNFTPLLHFIIPVEYMNLKSFAEIWIDQNNYEEPAEDGVENENIHMLIVFEIEGIGQFEADIVSINRQIDLTLLCPPNYTAAFQGMSARITDSLKHSPYSMNEIHIDPLDKNRSLMEVFKNLPHKRTGLDVTI